MSSLFLPRSWRMLCSPSTQRTASATLLLPLPLGPTTAVMPGANSRSVRAAKLLNPCNSRRLRYTLGNSSSTATRMVRFQQQAIFHSPAPVPDRPPASDAASPSHHQLSKLLADSGRPCYHITEEKPWR